MRRYKFYHLKITRIEIVKPNCDWMVIRSRERL